MATTTRQRHLPSRHKRPTTRKRPRTRRSYGIKRSPTTKRNTTRITRTSYGPRRQVNRIRACVVPRMHTGKPTLTTSRHKVGGECSFDVKIADDIIADDMYRTQVVRISATDPRVKPEQLNNLKMKWLRTKDTDGRVCPYPGLSSGPGDPYFSIKAPDNWPLIGWLEWNGGQYQCYIAIDDGNIIDILKHSDFQTVFTTNNTRNNTFIELKDNILAYYEQFKRYMKLALKFYTKLKNPDEARRRLWFARSIWRHIIVLAHSNKVIYDYIKTRIQDRKRENKQRDATECLQDIILADKPLEDIDVMIQKLDAL